MPRRGRAELRESPTLRVRPQEQLLIDTLPEISGGRILCNTAGRAQFAAACAQQLPEAQVRCFFLDLYQAEQARQLHAGAVPNLMFVCEPDLPAEEFDVVAFAVQRGGEAELTRDLLQAGHQRLSHGGRFIAAVDHPDDVWLHAEMKKLFPKVTRRTAEQGTLYLATKTQPLKKLKHFDAEFAFRDQGRLLRVYSRPGVFSHRRLDLGARALMTAMTIRPKQRVLDLGCGIGVVSLAAAVRAPDVAVQAVDSNPRAVQCVGRGSDLNGLTNITATLDAHGATVESEAFDLVLANPPYFSQYKIAEIFVQTAHRALRPGGRLQLVTKKADWYAERLPEFFHDARIDDVKGYRIVSGTKRRKRGPTS